MASLEERFEDLDFETLESAVRQSAKGRWFLDQFERRRRGSDTADILGAIARLERVISERDELPQPPRDAQLRQHQLKYFQADEDLFDTVKIAPALRAVEDHHPLDMKGARVQITRGEDATPPLPPQNLSVPETEAAPTAHASPTSSAPSKPRIVITRMSAAEAGIPLMEDESPLLAASAE